MKCGTPRRSPTAYCILDGLPNYQRLFSLRVGQTVREQFEADLAIEYEVMARLKPGIIMCREKEDATTANLFEKILADEEEHIDYLETQLRADGQARRAALPGAMRVEAAGGPVGQTHCFRPRSRGNPDSRQPSAVTFIACLTIWLWDDRSSDERQV